jgi:hypothetical protein
MQLSIEAIIVLVIAIVLLGVGIAFIKNFFEKASNPLEGQLESLKSCNANSNTPVLPTSYTVQAGGKEEGVEICIYNSEAAKLQQARITVLECLKPGSDIPVTGTSVPIKIQSLRFDLERSKAGLIPVTIDATTATDLGTYICSIQVAKASPTANDPKIGPLQVTFVVS